MFPSTSRRGPDDVAAALDLVERAESASNVLPTPGERATFEVRGRRLRRVAANGDLVARAGPSPADGEKLLGRDGVAVPVRLERRLAADEIRLAKLVGGPARVRAFYPALGATAAIHARTLRRPSRLRTAATVLGRFGAIEDHLAVPSLLEHGSWRRLDWLIEELVDGVHPRPEERADVVRTLLPGLIRAGAHFGWERRPVSAVLTNISVEEIIGLWDGLPTSPAFATEAVSRGLARRLHELLTERRPVVTALAHGDPVLSNVLRTTRGGLVLLDWELAGRLPVGHDAAKLVLGCDDAETLLDEVETDFVRHSLPGDLPWASQVAVGIVRMLGGWQRQRSAATASGRAAPYERGLLRRLTLLDRLLGG